MRLSGPASLVALALAACGVPAVVTPLDTDSGTPQGSGGGGELGTGDGDGGSRCACGEGFVCVPSTGECVPSQTQSGVEDPDAGPRVSCTDGEVKSCGASKLGECRLGTATCVDGAWGACAGAVHPAPELCNSLDDDCDGLIDEDQPSVSCGTGECLRTHSSCLNGSPLTCTPGGPTSELCNGKDDDCNGSVDDGLPSLSCGTGACARSVSSCSMSMTVTCTPGLPSAEVCNGVDDDCDGQTDESLGSTTCGMGACTRTVQNCAGGAAVSCTPGQAQAETCNGADDDCDGVVDDGFGTLSCGTGSCARSVPACSGGVAGVCTPGMSAPELCNGADDDCDGQIDEGLPVLSCGVGACARMTASCSMGMPLMCVAGMPGTETCNGADDNCDGATDEGLGSTTCGMGSCTRTVQNCVGGAVQSCTPGMSAPETCNNADDDCDGQTDEGLGNLTCGTGVCQRTVAACTSGVAGVCMPGAAGTETCNSLDDDCDGTVDDGVCAPVVTCSMNRTVNPNTSVALTSTAMSPTARPLTCQWSVVSRPASSSGTFSAPTSCTGSSYFADVVGVHTLRFTTTDSLGLTASCTVTVTVNPLGDLWIELTWNRNNDMDLHLRHATGGNLGNSNGWGLNASPWDCYYGLTNPSWDAAGTADDPSLDRDDISGQGPENIRINTPSTTHDYHVGVHLYTHASAPQNVTATMKVYCSGVLTTTQTRTFTAEDQLWVAGAVRFNTNGTCTYTADNRVFNYLP